jgi:hypothetical protein
MQTYSSLLRDSFRGSEPFRNNVVKGESREFQVLDVLEHLLPRRITVDRNVVVIDRFNAESPNFDGVIVDLLNFPALYRDGAVRVAMIESVAACVEVKSSLDSKELRDISRKNRRLHSMHKSADGVWAGGPIVYVFAYDCRNLGLSFLDYATSFWSEKPSAGSSVCVLNQAVFTSLEQSDQLLVPQDIPSQASLPGLLACSGDALLVWLFLLSRWVSRLSPAEELLRAYGRDVLEEQAAFYFEPEFLDRIAARQEDREAARSCFLRKGDRDIRDVYDEAKRRIGVG